MVGRFPLLSSSLTVHGMCRFTVSNGYFETSRSASSIGMQLDWRRWARHRLWWDAEIEATAEPRSGYVHRPGNVFIWKSVLSVAG
jgi:hypothetical protein